MAHMLYRDYIRIGFLYSTGRTSKIWGTLGSSGMYKNLYGSFPKQKNSNIDTQLL